MISALHYNRVLIFMYLRTQDLQRRINMKTILMIITSYVISNRIIFIITSKNTLAQQIFLRLDHNKKLLNQINMFAKRNKKLN